MTLFEWRGVSDHAWSDNLFLNRYTCFTFFYIVKKTSLQIVKTDILTRGRHWRVPQTKNIEFKQGRSDHLLSGEIRYFMIFNLVRKVGYYTWLCYSPLLHKYVVSKTTWKKNVRRENWGFQCFYFAKFIDWILKHQMMKKLITDNDHFQSRKKNRWLKTKTELFPEKNCDHLFTFAGNNLTKYYEFNDFIYFDE